MKFFYALVVGFVAASMASVVYRFEPNRVLARALIAIIYLTSALAILAKLGRGSERLCPFSRRLLTRGRSAHHHR
jgi:hypothetical protein